MRTLRTEPVPVATEDEALAALAAAGIERPDLWRLEAEMLRYMIFHHVLDPECKAWVRKRDGHVSADHPAA